MQITYKTLSFKRLLDIDNYAHLICDIALNEHSFDTLLYSVKPILEYTFGIYVGYVLGWLLGLCIGHTYVEHFAPAYLVDLGQLPYWKLLPYGFARNIGIAAAIGGVIAVAIINNRILNDRIVSLYKSGTTNPHDIAEALGKGEELIERKLAKLL